MGADLGAAVAADALAVADYDFSLVILDSVGGAGFDAGVAADAAAAVDLGLGCQEAPQQVEDGGGDPEFYLRGGGQEEVGH